MQRSIWCGKCASRHACFREIKIACHGQYKSTAQLPKPCSTLATSSCSHRFLFHKVLPSSKWVYGSPFAELQQPHIDAWVISKRYQHTDASAIARKTDPCEAATPAIVHKTAQDSFQAALENAHIEVLDDVVTSTSGCNIDHDICLFGSDNHLIEVPLSGLLARGARSRRKAHHAFAFRVDCIAKAVPYTGTSRVGDYNLDNLISDVDTMVLDALCAEEQRMVLEKYEESFSFKVFMPERAIQRHALTLVGEGYAVDHEAVTRNTERMLRHRIAMPAALMHAPESIEASDALHKFRWKTLTRVAKHGRQGYEVAWQLFARHLRDGCTTTRMFNTMLDACTSAEEQRVLWRHMLSHTGHQHDVETFKRISRTAHVWHDTELLEELAVAIGSMQSPSQECVQLLLPPPQETLEKLRTRAIQKYLTMGLNGYKNCWRLYNTLQRAGLLAPSITTAMLHACKTPREQLDTVVANALQAGFAANVKDFNRVIDRYLVEGNEEGISAVLRRMKAAGVPTTDVTTARAMHRRPEVLADMQSDTLERLTEWEDPVQDDSAVVDDVFRALIQNECVTSEHLEIMLYDARVRGNADRLEAVALTGAHLQMLPHKGSGTSIYRKLIRNIHSLSTIMLFLSIPPALITG